MKGVKLLCVFAVMALMSAALLMTNSGFKLIARTKSDAESRLLTAAENELPTEWTTTPGPVRTNLKGKMFTLSSAWEGIHFYRPSFIDTTPNPWSTSTSYRPPTTRPPTTRPPTTRPPTTRPPTTRCPTTRPPTTRIPTTRRPTTRPPTTHYWTTAPSYRGVSVCLRYLTAPIRGITLLFTLSPSTAPLKLSTDSLGTYILPLRSYPYEMYLTPAIRLWKNMDPEIWNRICLTVDNTRNVVQLFSGANMSIRHIMQSRYVWSGEPVIDVSGFDGQVTDVQVWDYPLRYKEVFNYMTNGVYASYSGSVITWSSISYSLRGNAVLEDVYERQKVQPISSQRGG